MLHIVFLYCEKIITFILVIKIDSNDIYIIIIMLYDIHIFISEFQHRTGSRTR